MNEPLTDSDRGAGFKDVRVAMLNGRFEVVRVSRPTSAKLAEFMSDKPSAKMVYQFVTTVTGKNLAFALDMDPRSFADVFMTASGLLGMEEPAKAAAKQVGLEFLRLAEGKI